MLDHDEGTLHGTGLHHSGLLCAAQEFSADLNSRPVKRIDDVTRLRSAQFVEDAGAMAHPIRPDSYIKMDNFYTLTVYEKGAEIVRLYHTLLGPAGFRWASTPCDPTSQCPCSCLPMLELECLALTFVDQKMMTCNDQ